MTIPAGVATIEAEVPCPACGSTSGAPVFPRSAADEYEVLTCRQCGLARTVPQPADAMLRGLYQADYRTASGQKFVALAEAGRRAFARALAARIARRVGSGGRALDIGCGDGKLLAALAARGFEGVGTELNQAGGASPPAERDFRVHAGPVEDLRLPSASFRVVVFRHVLEHLRDPVRTLRDARRLVEPGGVLVVAVPNLASWQARVARARWFHLDLPRHLFHFTPATLTSVLERAGFTVERIGHFSFEQNPFGWLQSIFNMLGGRWQALYGQLRAPASPHGAVRDAFAVAAALALVPLCVALSIGESLARRGGTIEAWGRPKTSAGA